MHPALKILLASLGSGTLVFFGAMLFLKPDSRYHVVAYREYASPTADQGFGGLGDGFRSKQSFYWDEIALSKELKLEALKELGKGLDHPYALPILYSEKYSEAEDRRSLDGLFLILNFNNLYFEDAPRDMHVTALHEFAAFERAFTSLIKKRGASITPLTEARFYWTDRWFHPRYMAMNLLLIFSGSIFGSLATYTLFRKSKNAA